MIQNSATQKTLSINSPKHCGTIFKRNLTLEDQRLKSIYLKDKETMFEEIQQLKQEKNNLIQTIRKQQSQLQYFKKEVTQFQRDEASPNYNYTRLKQSYIERLASIQEENQKLKEELGQTQNYLKQLKNPIEQQNIDIYCMQLSDDNVHLTKILEQIEKQNNELQKINHKLTIKLNAQTVKCQKLRGLNKQLLLEIDILRRKNIQYDNKPSQRDIQKGDEKIIIELEQAKIDIRNYQQKVKLWENKYNCLQLEHQDKIAYLEKKNKEFQKQLSTLELQFEQEKQQYQQMQQQFQQQRYLRRTVVLKNPQIFEDQQEQKNNENEIQIKKNITVNKNDVQPIAKKIRLRLIGLKLPLNDVEKYLLTSENLTFNQLEENLHQSIFGLEDSNEIHMLAAYLADIEDESESTTSSRVRSIFKTLMENYIILDPQQLDSINLTIMNKKQELQEILMKKYPETFTNGFMKIEVYLDILNQLDIHFSKIEIDHLQALISKQNRSPCILLQQIYAPFYIPEIQLNSNSNIDNDDDDELANPLIGENPMLSENPLYSENQMSMSIVEDQEQMSALDIKMCNSQELKKKSQSELPQNQDEFKILNYKSIKKHWLFILLSFIIDSINNALDVCKKRNQFISYQVLLDDKNLQKPIVLFLEALLTFTVCTDIALKVLTEGLVLIQLFYILTIIKGILHSSLEYF
ncbi:unnamed protein product [Paramecium sonneborni]|uniref:Uncharacterized protein n=1 Tax=Paramecium sonneborni TaxID=65129 RepID=A0A8S1RE89_9CILI|nr:unnamed protein product [Paramecium sonneborni]